MNASKALNSLCCRCIFLFIDSLLYSSQYLQYCLSVYIVNRVSISSSNLDMSSVSLCAFIAWHFESIRISYFSWKWKGRRTELRISRSSPKEATNSWYKCSETTCEVLDWRIFLENRLTISQTDNSYSYRAVSFTSTFESQRTVYWIPLQRLMSSVATSSLRNESLMWSFVHSLHVLLLKAVWTTWHSATPHSATMRR